MSDTRAAPADAPYTGGCLCGAVRFSSTRAPLVVRMCWCTTCQKLAAGNASVNAIFAVDHVTIDGETAAYASRADSGNLIVRRFCPACGTPMFAEATARPDVMAVRVGVLDEPARVKPERVIWTSSAPSWAHIDPALDCVAGQPAPVKA